ncbi:MAG TPA: septal ring lytic transglycosylase RlpA family protein [Bryobacteraceae bacterium]|nr:septal ring lytic transglycosylase RlpA family protein [Bryobacteraceae bacterium]
MRKALLVAAAASVVLAGCHRQVARNAPIPPPPASAPPEESAAPTTTPPAPSPIPPIIPGVPPESGETGIASWYGNPFHGRASASGEIYDMEQMTAAHRTLPFGTLVRVHNLDNQKTVDVRINDRGPFVDGRVIDLSHAAARTIEMIGPGTAHVQLEILTQPAAISTAFFGVQVGSFRNRDNAQRLRREMAAKYGRARLVERADTPGFWHVVVGQETTPDGAAALGNRISGENSSILSALVVRIDSI